MTFSHNEATFDCAGQLLESKPRNVRQSADVGKRVHCLLFPCGTSLPALHYRITAINDKRRHLGAVSYFESCTPFNRASYSEHQWRENTPLYGACQAENTISCVYYTHARALPAKPSVFRVLPLFTRYCPGVQCPISTVPGKEKFSSRPVKAGVSRIYSQADPGSTPQC